MLITFVRAKKILKHNILAAKEKRPGQMRRADI